MLTGKSRERMTAQVAAAAERIGSSVMTVLAVALAAVVIAAGALITSLRALRAVQA